MTLQEIGITISAYDHSGQALGKVTSYFAKPKREISDAWTAGKKLTAAMKGISAAGNVAIGTEVSMGAGLGFRLMAEDAGQAEHSLAQLGNIANLLITFSGKWKPPKPNGDGGFMAESKRFELLNGFPRYTISNRAPSATRTTLQ